MEPTFQKSFIPKKSLAETNNNVKASKTSFFLVFAVFIFILVAGLYGGLYFYKSALSSNLTAMKADLDRANKRFEPEKITELSLLDRRLNAGTEVLKRHLAISPIFKELQNITVKTVQYTKFTYDLDDLSKNLVDIKMQGRTVDYRTVAVQANVFSKNKNFIQPVFSNLSVDDKGSVLFDLDFKVLRSFVDFEQSILAEKSNAEIQNSGNLNPISPQTTNDTGQSGAILEDLNDLE